MRSAYLDFVLKALQDEFLIPFSGQETSRSIGGENMAVDVCIFMNGLNSPVIHWTESYLADGHSKNSLYPKKTFAPYESPEPKEFAHRVSCEVLGNPWVAKQIIGKLRDEVMQLRECCSNYEEELGLSK
ncbi:hypothetical protein [Brazilian marseillevirus]|uniref:hypothetical protein n=1 Tax=Brazilian marseillevirus TaxID=1813599 RepID=UPI0007840504|nr:hypothetical protein A3303_gp061 [Brazilian marseillevirus]AMQ10569.1 hypothetical protein [Brazilian marseillevirus]